MLTKKKKMTMVVVVTLFVCFFAAFTQAGERVGTLVFETMRKIEVRQRGFMEDVRKIRAERAEALRKRNSVRTRYMKEQDGSLEQKEAHAEYSYVLANIYKNIFREVKLVRGVSNDHLLAINALKDGLKKGSLYGDKESTIRIIRGTNEFFASSAGLLDSLSKYSDDIQDPEIHRAISSASATAKYLKAYINKLEKTSTGATTTEKLLKKKIDELAQNMEQLYLQTGVLMDMVKNQSNILKLANQVAMSDLVIARLSETQQSMSSFGAGVLDPLKDILRDADTDLNTLGDGLLGNGADLGNGAVDRSWTEGL